jgi:hypothetical protein
MTLDADEVIRRFLIHVLPDGFHRIRHYGLFANGNRANNIALARRLLGAPDQLAGALTPIAPTVVMKTKSGIFVLAAAGAWSSSRPSDPAASRDCGPFQQSPSTAHDESIPAWKSDHLAGRVGDTSKRQSIRNVCPDRISVSTVSGVMASVANNRSQAWASPAGANREGPRRYI